MLTLLNFLGTTRSQEFSDRLHKFCRDHTKSGVPLSVLSDATLSLKMVTVNKFIHCDHCE